MGADIVLYIWVHAFIEEFIGFDLLLVQIFVLFCVSPIGVSPTLSLEAATNLL